MLIDLLDPVSQKTARVLVFATPTIFFYLMFGVISIFPWYSGPFFALGLVYLMHHVSPLRSCSTMGALTYGYALLNPSGYRKSHPRV